MTVKELKKIAKQQGINTQRMKKADIVRAIQTGEGNDPCFQTGAKEICGQYECLWRPDCR